VRRDDGGDFDCGALVDSDLDFVGVHDARAHILALTKSPSRVHGYTEQTVKERVARPGRKGARGGGGEEEVEEEEHEEQEEEQEEV